MDLKDVGCQDGRWMEPGQDLAVINTWFLLPDRYSPVLTVRTACSLTLKILCFAQTLFYVFRMIVSKNNIFRLHSINYLVNVTEAVRYEIKLFVVFKIIIINWFLGEYFVT